MDHDDIRSALASAARSAPVNPDRPSQVLARARRSTVLALAAAGVTATVAVIGVLSAVVWVGNQSSPSNPARSAGPHYVSFSRVVLREGALDIAFTGGDPALRPGDRCYESYSITTEPGTQPDEVVVWIKVDYPSPPPNPTPSLHTACDALGYPRHSVIPVDREYTVAVDGSTGIRHPVGKDGAGQPT